MKARSSVKHTPFRCLVIALAATIIPISFPIVALAAETETNNAASARYDLIGSITDTTGTPVNDAAIYVNNAHPRIGPDRLRSNLSRPTFSFKFSSSKTVIIRNMWIMSIHPNSWALSDSKKLSSESMDGTMLSA
jgi:hypothetical protein